jgi:hypothetical protein
LMMIYLPTETATGMLMGWISPAMNNSGDYDDDGASGGKPSAKQSYRSW